MPKLIDYDQAYIRENILIDSQGCWIWQRSIMPNGYGEANRSSGERTAHRLSYRLFCGEIPAWAVVRHSCDVRACCNPEHLSIGHQTDNMQDAKERGRVKFQSAEHMREINKLANLSRQIPQHKIEEVIRRVNNGEHKDDVALSTGLSRSSIYKIIKGTNHER